MTAKPPNAIAAVGPGIVAATYDHRPLLQLPRVLAKASAKRSRPAAGNHARGAALGQMFGFAVKEAGNDYFDAATAFLLDASDGSVNYGTSLMNWG